MLNNEKLGAPTYVAPPPRPYARGQQRSSNPTQLLLCCPKITANKLSIHPSIHLFSKDNKKERSKAKPGQAKPNQAKLSQNQTKAQGTRVL